MVGYMICYFAVLFLALGYLGVECFFSGRSRSPEEDRASSSPELGSLARPGVVDSWLEEEERERMRSGLAYAEAMSLTLEEIRDLPEDTPRTETR